MGHRPTKPESLTDEHGAMLETLALRLHFLLHVAALCDGLVRPSPERPCDDVGRWDASLCKSAGNAAAFLDRPADKAWRAWVRGRRGSVFCGAGWFAWWRTWAMAANASMTKDTCRCQPCQDRTSLWWRPSSVLAHSKLSSMAQRCPSTATRVLMPGVEKPWAGQAASDSARSGVSRPSRTAARTTAMRCASRGDQRIRCRLAILALAISSTQPSARELDTGRPTR